MLSSYNINIQLAKFEKNLSVGSISVEWPWRALVSQVLNSAKSTILNAMKILKIEWWWKINITVLQQVVFLEYC